MLPSMVPYLAYGEPYVYQRSENLLPAVSPVAAASESSSVARWQRGQGGSTPFWRTFPLVASEAERRELEKALYPHLGNAIDRYG